MGFLIGGHNQKTNELFFYAGRGLYDSYSIGNNISMAPGGLGTQNVHKQVNRRHNQTRIPEELLLQLVASMYVCLQMRNLSFDWTAEVLYDPT